MSAAYRDDGAFTLCLHAIWVFLTGGRHLCFPPKGFVGLGSSSLVVTDLHHSKLVSIQLRRGHSTPSAPPWRLTYVWEISQPPPPPSSYGGFWGHVGKRWVGGGAVTSRRSTLTISISDFSTYLTSYKRR